MSTASESHPPELIRAAQEAEELMGQIRIRGGDLGPAFEALEAAIPAFEKAGYQLEALLPSSHDAGLGFGKPGSRTGRGFWEVYSQAVRSSLCDPVGELRSAVKLGLGTSATSVVGAIMSVLALPLAACAIVAPIAAILMTIGLDAYCEWSKDESEREP